jgi:hypothetical protein
MTRYFFHLFNAVNIRDDVGRVFATLDEARLDAIKACRALMANDLQNEGQITLSHRIEIVGDDSLTKLVLPFRACVEIRP